MATLEALRDFTIPFCCFNGGADVWVDVGNKKLGVRALQSFLGTVPANTVHFGDQFTRTGNDTRAREVAQTIWVSSPSETVYFLTRLVEIHRIVAERGRRGSLHDGGASRHHHRHGHPTDTGHAAWYVGTNSHVHDSDPASAASAVATVPFGGRPRAHTAGPAIDTAEGASAAVGSSVGAGPSIRAISGSGSGIFDGNRSGTALASLQPRSASASTSSSSGALAALLGVATEFHVSTPLAAASTTAAHASTSSPTPATSGNSPVPGVPARTTGLPADIVLPATAAADRKSVV